MFISEKQLQLLIMVLRDSLNISDAQEAFGINRNSRMELLNNILNQQSEKIIEVKGEDS